MSPSSTGLTLLQLLDRCLKIVDPELYAHLRSKNLSAEIYAFPCESPSRGNPTLLPTRNLKIWLTAQTPSCINSLCMYSPSGSSLATLGLSSCFRCPLECTLRDCPASPHARRCYGFSQVRLNPKTLAPANKYATPSPMRLLRTFPPLEALPVIGIAVTLVRDLPTELYEELVRHPYEIHGQ